MTVKSSRPRILLVTRSIVLDERNRILLIKRGKAESWKFDFWELPGGKLDEGQDISHALEREVFEETKLVVTPINRIAFYDSEILTKGKYKGLTYICLVGISRSEEIKVKLSDEHSDYKWVKYKDAFKGNLTEETEKALVVLKKHFKN